MKIKATYREMLNDDRFTRQELEHLLGTTDPGERHGLFRQAYRVKRTQIGNVVYLRGLLEISNLCRKDCLYCGIRKSNSKVERYSLAMDEVLELARYAWRMGYGSIVIQSGERTDKAFVEEITGLLGRIKQETRNELGITLSCGEQTEETYRRWLDAGAHRYLLRIETSSEELFNSIHPQDGQHLFSDRMQALERLRKTGYQTGTGVMIGLPGQTAAHLADDLLFFRDFGIDMIGMGPYIPHQDAPLASLDRDSIPPPDQRLELSLRMIALARILLKDVNIAASTALQALDPDGRIKAILAGANVFMPNLTPEEKAKNYFLYDGKPLVKDQARAAIMELEDRLHAVGEVIGYGKWGDSKHYFKHLTPIPPQESHLTPIPPLQMGEGDSRKGQTKDYGKH
jgi:biotin synthase